MAPKHPYKRSTVGKVRLVVAWLCTLAALAFCILGFIDPATVGFAGNETVFYLSGPPLAVAAVAHLYLVAMGTRSRTDVTVPGEQEETYNPSAKFRKV